LCSGDFIVARVFSAVNLFSLRFKKMQNRFVRTQTKFSISMELTAEEAKELRHALFYLQNFHELPKFMEGLLEELSMETTPFE
jgi:hypothetical protein